MPNPAERLAQTSMRLTARALFRRGRGGHVDLRGIHRVLVVRVDDRVGNVLLTTPLMRALREGLPHARLDWLIAEKRKHLVEGLFLADRLIPYGKARNPAALASLLWELRRARYDLVIEAAHWDILSTTQALIARWTGAPVRVGAARGEAERFFTHAVPIPEERRQDVAARLTLLDPLGLEERGMELETSIGLDGSKAQSLLERLQLDPRRFFVVNPGARKIDRRTEPEAVGALVARLARATGLAPLVVWGPGEEPLAQAVVDASKKTATLAPATDLDLLAALLRHARLLVTNDTGPMHLGVACGTPVLALFLQADADRWGHPIPTFRALQVGQEDLEEAAERAATELVSTAASAAGEQT